MRGHKVWIGTLSMGLVLAVSVAVPGLLKATSTSGATLPTLEYYVALDCGSGPGVDCNIPAPASGALDVTVKFGNPVALGGPRNIAGFNFDVFNPNAAQLGVGLGVPVRNPAFTGLSSCASPAADDDTGAYGAGTTDSFLSCIDPAGAGDTFASDSITTLGTVHYNMNAAAPGSAALKLFSVAVADPDAVPVVTCDLDNTPPSPPIVSATQCVNVTINFTGVATATNTAVPPTATSTNTPVPPTATNTPVPPTATMTNTPVPPTATNTAVPPTATNTAVPPTATNTAVPPTSTNTPVGVPTSTNTPVPPTATNTAVPPTATNTAVPPTATNTAVPPTATNTSVPPTATNTSVPPTATNTSVPPTATNTAVPPTATNTPAGVPTSTNTPVVSQTAQPSQTAQVTLTPQITLTPQVTHTAQPSQTPPTATSTYTPVPTATNTSTPEPTDTPHANKTHTPQATSTQRPSTPQPTATTVAAVAGAAKPPARGGAAGTITLPNAGQGGGNSTLSYMLAILLLAGTGTGMVGAVVYRQHRR
ncbi:MAG: hypothetical protein HY874_11750 [Chloroflexi bacterium]|nr:hypothetical protein [Chloroflexota bacterium]